MLVRRAAGRARRAVGTAGGRAQRAVAAAQMPLPLCSVGALLSGRMKTAAGKIFASVRTQMRTGHTLERGPTYRVDPAMLERRGACVWRVPFSDLSRTSTRERELCVCDKPHNTHTHTHTAHRGWVLVTPLNSTM